MTLKSSGVSQSQTLGSGVDSVVGYGERMRELGLSERSDSNVGFGQCMGSFDGPTHGGAWTVHVKAGEGGGGLHTGNGVPRNKFHQQL